MAEDKLAQARQLMALAVASPYAEEGRTAAIAAIRLIHDHKMLSSMPPAASSTHQGLSGPPVGHLEAEIKRLRHEVFILKQRRQAPPAPAVSHAMVLDAVDKMREIESLRAEVARLRALPVSSPVYPLVASMTTIAAVAAIHVVRAGDTPMGIARDYTGDPRRMTELVYANGHKPTYLASGWRTFTSLYPGERLRLPASWV
jgi:nucleoid-associated protein YgaU